MLSLIPYSSEKLILSGAMWDVPELTVSEESGVKITPYPTKSELKITISSTFIPKFIQGVQSCHIGFHRDSHNL